jgi:hypothetical protein
MHEVRVRERLRDLLLIGEPESALSILSRA